LERKEYLLQVTENKYGIYEKLLMSLAERDPHVEAKLDEMKL